MSVGPEKGGSVLGGALLIAGSCIGAAMLGLPIITGQLGFWPTCFFLFSIWLFMACTGLLTLEVNLWFDRDVNLTTMAQRTLGPLGKVFCIGLFLFLFYSLLIGYVTGCGTLLAELCTGLFGVTVSANFGSLLFSALFTLSIYLGVRTVDQVNRALMLGLFLTYAWLLLMGVPKVTGSGLYHSNWSYALPVLPVMVISFGFHNLLPSVRRYMGDNTRRLRSAIFVGSSIPFFIYLLWEWLILGLVSPTGVAAFTQAQDRGALATQLLRDAVGSAWIVNVAGAFALFAIVTSFLGVALSLLDFLADLFHVKRTPMSKISLAMGVILPPVLCAFTYPGAFLTALSYAGSLGAAVLFGILPALMVWRGRYQLKMKGERLLPGGRVSLLAVMVVALVVVSAVFL